MLGKIVELIRLTATELSPDILSALKAARSREASYGAAQSIYDRILANADLAKEESIPLCQDTGIPIFRVNLPEHESAQNVHNILKKAVKKATKLNYLRPNAVDTLTGKNSGNGVGIGIPQVEITRWNKDYSEIGLMLKGGGSENVGAQFSLPDEDINANRDLDGVKNCVIEAVYQAQGKACPPYFIGVGIGGDRAGSMKLAKEQFWRKLKHSHPQLRDLEEDLLVKLNQLGIGPMGVGGSTTVLSVKADYLARLPASYFVSVAFTCWAFRARFLTIRRGEYTYE